MLIKLNQKKNKVLNLFSFLDANKNVSEGDDWYYVLHPEIVSYINTFDRVEGENLTLAIDFWDEEMCYNIADALLDIENGFIDGIGLYAGIFLKSSDADNSQYLVENIHLINDKLVRNMDLYERVLAKIFAIERESNSNYSFCKDQIQNKIDSLKRNC